MEMTMLPWGQPIERLLSSHRLSGQRSGTGSPPTSSANRSNRDTSGVQRTEARALRPSYLQVSPAESKESGTAYGATSKGPRIDSTVCGA